MSIRPNKGKGGRPSTYTVEVAMELCERLASGETHSSIWLDPRMPNNATMHRWLDAHPEFRANYERARKVAALALVEQGLDIVDATDAVNVNVAKLRSQYRQWLAGRYNSQLFGDKAAVELSGGDKPIDVNIASPHLAEALAVIDQVRAERKEGDHAEG